MYQGHDHRMIKAICVQITKRIKKKKKYMAEDFSAKSRRDRHQCNSCLILKPTANIRSDRAMGILRTVSKRDHFLEDEFKRGQYS